MKTVVFSTMKKIPPRPQKSFGLTLGKWVLAAEGIFVLYAYSIYYRLNRYQDFRYKYYKKHPLILKSYYAVGETLGGLETRKHDLEHWNRLENKGAKS